MHVMPRISATLVAAAIVVAASAQRCGTWQWTNPVPRPVSFNAVAGGNGMLLALGSSQVATSVDGVNWDVHDVAPPPFVSPGALQLSWAWDAVIWDGSRFVAVGGPYIASSADGEQWTTTSLPAGTSAQHVIGGDDSFVLFGDQVFASTDGVT